MTANGMDVISNHNTSVANGGDILTTNEIATQVAQALKRLALGRLEVDIAQAANRHDEDELLPSDGPPVTYKQRRDALDDQIVALRAAFSSHILIKVDELLANQD